MYLNVYMPLLQTAGGVAYYLHKICGNPVPSLALLAPRSRRFVAAIERFVKDHGIDLIRFQRGERKDHRAQDYLRRFSGTEGLLFVGKAQEKARVPRTERRRNANSDSTYPWLMSSTAFVNYYYFYVVDEDFGPCFIKFCSHFPFNAKLCLNGHEYLKRQLAREGIAFEELDNGILSCADPQRMQQPSDGLTSARIAALLRKWLALLPHPYHSADRVAGMLLIFNRPRQQAYAVALSYPRDHPRRGPFPAPPGRMTYDLRRLRLHGLIEHVGYRARHNQIWLIGHHAHPTGGAALHILDDG